MEVSIERISVPPWGRDLAVTFSFNEFAFAKWRYERYGVRSLGASESPLTILCLLAEYSLHEQGKYKAVIEIMELEPITPILPPATENNHGLL
jgi:hypothetical protein